MELTKANDNLKKSQEKNRQLTRDLALAETKCKQLVADLNFELESKSTVIKHVDQVRIIDARPLQAFGC